MQDDRNEGDNDIKRKKPRNYSCRKLDGKINEGLKPVLVLSVILQTYFPDS